MPIKHHSVTDTDMDPLYDYFINEEKFNEQLRPEFDKEMARKNEKMQKEIEKYNRDNNNNSSESSSSSQEYDFNSDSSNSSKSSTRSSETTVSESTPYKKIYRKSERRSKYTDRKYRTGKNIAKAGQLMLGQHLIDDVEKYVETPEEKRARAREEYTKLQDLVERYDVELTRHYSIDSDPDEMHEEFEMHRSKRRKHNKIKFYKSLLLNCVCGIEFVNGKYNPFEFKLDDWSKQVALDMDDYTEIIEEIYDSHKSAGKEMRPEFRLVFMLVFSAITYHVSKSLFGSEGIGSIINQNPGLINKMTNKIFTKGKNNENEPEIELPPDNKSLVDAIRNRNKSKTKSIRKSENKSETNSELRKMLTEQYRNQNKLLEKLEQIEKRDEIFNNRINTLNNRISNDKLKSKRKSSESKNIGRSIKLSDVNTLPRFMRSQKNNESSSEENSNQESEAESNQESEENSDQESEESIIRSEMNLINNLRSVQNDFNIDMESEKFDTDKKECFKNIDDLEDIDNALDSLSKLDSDIDNIIKSNRRKTPKKSITKSTARSTRGGTEISRTSGRPTLKL